MKHSPGKGLSVPREDLDSFHRLKGPDHAGKGAKDACFLSCGDRAGWRRFRKQASVARRAQSRIKDGKLSFELMDRAGNRGFTKEPRGICHQKAGRKVVRAVNDHVILPEEICDVVLIEPFMVELKTDVRVQTREAVGGTLHLLFADKSFVVKNLSLKIREFNGIVVH